MGFMSPARFACGAKLFIMMQVNYSRSMIVAQMVLNAILLRQEEDDYRDLELSIQAYQNGREQGLGLHFRRKLNTGVTNVFATFRCYMVSEHRNSDSIVVYESSMDPMQSITDEMYTKGQRLFKYDEYVKAADYILRDAYQHAVLKPQFDAKVIENLIECIGSFKTHLPERTVEVAESCLSAMERDFCSAEHVAAIREALVARGFKANENVDDEFNQDDPTNFARYIMGQILIPSPKHTIGMVHAGLRQFTKDWRERYGKKREEVPA